MFCELTSILLIKLNNDTFSPEWTNKHIFLTLNFFFSHTSISEAFGTLILHVLA